MLAPFLFLIVGMVENVDQGCQAHFGLGASLNPSDLKVGGASNITAKQPGEGSSVLSQARLWPRTALLMDVEFTPRGK